MNIQWLSRDEMIAMISDPKHIENISDSIAEKKYEKTDWDLQKKIQMVFESFSAPRDSYFQIEDWWPNHLRGVELNYDLFRDELFLSLMSLLNDSYPKFRIILHFYTNFDLGSNHICSILIDGGKTIFGTRENIGT